MLGVWRLQLLREVSRRGTIRAAADALSITPSAVSQQLRILAEEAGVPLLEPNGRLLRLTDAGEMLVRHADTIMAAIVAAESDLAATRDEISGDLRVAAFPTAARAILPSVIAELGRAHPRLRLTLRDLETAEAMAAIRLDEVDLALVDQYDDVTRIREPGVELVELPGDQLFVALPPAHPHAGGAVRLDELAADHWIMDTEASNIYGAVVRGCRTRGFEPNVRSHCRDYSVIIALVEAGLGVAILPGLALRDREIRARVLPLDPPQDRRISIALKPERRSHPAVAAMVGALLRFA
jgi:DNA-binding transcriptional LysR family regulator